MNRNADVLQDLIQLARDGAVFYTDAAREVEDPTLVPLFNRVATARRELSSALGGRLGRSGAEVPTSGTFSGPLRKSYTEVPAKLSSNDGKVLSTSSSTARIACSSISRTRSPMPRASRFAPS